jgi:hypothetical protein
MLVPLEKRVNNATPRMVLFAGSEERAGISLSNLIPNRRMTLLLVCRDLAALLIKLREPGKILRLGLDHVRKNETFAYGG